MKEDAFIENGYPQAFIKSSAGTASHRKENTVTRKPEKRILW